MNGPSWTCLGEGPAHPADLEEIEPILETGSTLIAVQRCRICGQLYRWLHYELNDWSGSGDYCAETTIWTVLEPDEVDSVRRDPNYSPRSGREHRHDTGWRREGA
ncbi:MAG: hypothetical protein M3N07_01060 [Pseudomonadota bacterium]|nr:hypothetical protein [Pseudomonadota bacterium]